MTGRSTTGARNGNWKGGRSVTSHGYVLIRVGKGHHLADVRGYAYEHRLVAEQKIGRALQPGEEVHHENERKADNSQQNLEPCKSKGHHRVLHRKVGVNRRLPDEVNPSIECACGCGTAIQKFDKWKRPRRFVSGHNKSNDNGRWH